MPLHQRHWQLLILYGIVDGSGAGSDLEHPNLSIFRAPPVPTTSKGLKKTCLAGAQSPPLFVLIFVVLSYFILFYFDLVNFSF